MHPHHLCRADSLRFAADICGFSVFGVAQSVEHETEADACREGVRALDTLR